MFIAIIGSKAANYWHPEIWSNPKDEDYIATLNDFMEWYELHQKIGMIKTCYPFDDGRKYYVERIAGPIIEVEIAYPGSSAEAFLQKINPHGDLDGYCYPDMDWLFALKKSHRYLKDSPHFEKTMNDYHQMRNLGCKVPDEEWFKWREEETYNKPRPNLNRSKDQFFVKDAGVQYIYDHDTLHLAVAQMNGVPAYKSYQPENSEVMVSKKKWDECSDEIKILGVLEESYVLALERSQIPYRDQISPYESFKIALSKVCTSITSGWFREFAYENYYKVLKDYRDDYLKWFDKAVENGIVKKVDEGKAIASV